MTYALGVDLGTTYSAAAVCRGGRVETFTLGTTAPSIPSVVVLRADGDVLVGEAADRRAAVEPTRTAREFKRRLGDPTPIVLGGTPYGAEALVAQLLKAIVAQVTEREGDAPDRIVLTHPANYGPYKTGLLQEAARLAGLDLTRVRYATEPEAAAVAYAEAQRIEAGDVVAVYDFGGGTFDAAVVRKSDEGFEIVGTPEGMERLGGIDIDAAVLAHVNDTLDGMLSDLDTTDEITRAALARLRDECRKAKEALSTDTDTTIPVAIPGLQTEVRLTREELEAMIRPRLTETVDALQRAVVSAGLSMDEVSRILLVGGTSRLPLVSQLVREVSGRPVALDAHPKLAIATGAALLGNRVDDERALAAPAAAPAVGAATGATAVGVATAGSGLAAGAAVGGAAFAGTVGGAAVLRGLSGTPAHAADGVTAAAPGAPPTTPLASPPSTPLASPPSAPMTSPPSTPLTSPPSTPASPAPTPAPVKAATRAGRTPAKKLPLVIGGVVGVAAGVAAVVTVVGGGEDTPPGDLATTDAVTTQEASAPTTAAAGSGTTTARAVDTFAGSGEQGTAGEGGPAVDAALDRPESVAVSSTGDVYIADNVTQRILKVSKGILTVLHSVTPGQASNTYGVAVAPDDSVWFSSSLGVFKMEGTTAKLVLDEQVQGAPFALTFDKAGNLYIGEIGGSRVAKYDTSGRLTIIAGTGEPSPQLGAVGDGGPATEALVGRPIQIAVDGTGNVYIAEQFAERIRKVAPDGTISTFAGGGSIDIEAAKDGAAAKDIIFNTVDGVALDEKGNVYVADHQYGNIVRFSADGTNMERVLGPADGVRSPFGMAFGSDGALYYIDGVVVRRVGGVG